MAGTKAPLKIAAVNRTTSTPGQAGSSSLDDLRNFPYEARKEAGFALYSIQCGLEPNDWKPMPAMGCGVREIRIHVLGEWRIVYVAKFGDAVYVLHSFQKKSRKTNQRDIELARKRFKQNRYESFCPVG